MKTEELIRKFKNTERAHTKPFKYKRNKLLRKCFLRKFPVKKDLTA